MNIHDRRENSRWISLIFSLWVLMPLAGCGPNPVPILSNPTCQPPCWKNIRPGETTKEEAVSLLKELPEVDSTTIALNGKPWNIFEDIIYFGFKDSEVHGRVYISNDKAVFIEISRVGDLELDTTFGEAVNMLGEPEYIINIPISGGLPLAPKTNFIIIAIQPERGFGFDYDTRYLPGYQKAELLPENKLRGITFFDPAFFDQLLEAGFFSPGHLHSNETRKYMIPWEGYGALEEKYPPASVR
jgi:hypothetical protein